MILSIPFLILDLILGIYINSYFNLSLIICISYYTRHKYEKKITYVLLIGFIYDLIFSGILFLNTFIYLIIYIITNKIKHLNIYIVYLIDIIIYIILNYLLLYIYTKTHIDLLFISKTILFNLMVFHITYFLYKKLTK
jgi:hypothetical protein